MEATSSTIDNETSSSTTDSKSTTISPPLSPAAVNGSLCRMGSGTTSVVIDVDANGTEADSPILIIINTTTTANNNTTTNKLPSSKYKGVVPQPNGRWGAQIYEKHQRVWLGTFNQESDAARAYDVAAQRFRGPDSVTNFSPLSDVDELRFIASRSKAEVVDMLRKHTYHDELLQSKRMTINSSASRTFLDSLGGSSDEVGTTTTGRREHLFEKVVTPSDVGKLNRLVIPKQHAEKHFPLQGGINCNSVVSGSCSGNSSSSKGVLLNFEDDGRKVWRFRYSYWNSSQSYVLTKGWSRFVKENNLNSGDTVSFQRSTVTNNPQLYIQCKPKSIITASHESVPVHASGPGSGSKRVEMMRLFGVDICRVVAEGNAVCNGNGKRLRELDLSMGLGMESTTKKTNIVIAAL